jgi:hypothetical protein
MYVIFPADEIIFLSYGVAEHPRIQRRPTLDILIDPIVPSASGIRPLPSSSNLEIDSSSNYHNNSRTSSQKSSTAIVANNTTNHVLRSTLASPSTPRTPTTPNLNNNNLLNFDQNHLRRDPSPNQVSFAADFMNKSRTSVVDDISLRADDLGGSVVDNSNSPKKKNRIKNKISISKISLGKLGRPSSNESEPTSSRLREDLDLRIANPTFTRENLREKNFDAFFASGEPVYSLEKKEKQISDASNLSLLTPLSDATTIETPSSFANSPLPPPRKSSISAFFPPKFSSKQAKNSSIINSSKRPKSVESSVVKGDRCHIHDDL